MAGEITQVGTKIPWEIKNTDFEAVYNESYFVDCNGAPKIVTLPYTVTTAPSVGDTIIFDNYTKTAGTFDITIQAHASDGGSGNLLVEGVPSQDIIIDVNAVAVRVVYVDGTYGWRYKVI